MTFVAWVKDYRANHFNKEKWWSPRATPPGDVGEPKYEIVGKYDNMEEAEKELKAYFIYKKKIFNFIWEYLDTNGMERFKEAFPQIYAFDRFEWRWELGGDLNDQFFEDLLEIKYFSDYTNFHGCFHSNVSDEEDLEEVEN